MICNKILGKVTKFGENRTETLGVANRFMVGGTLCPPPLECAPPPPLGFIGLNNHMDYYYRKECAYIFTKCVLTHFLEDICGNIRTNDVYRFT